MRAMRARRKTKDVDNAKLDAKFSRDVKERDGYECQMEVWYRRKWRKCGSKGSPMNPLDAAHIYGRPYLPATLKYHKVVGITACRDHHDSYDRRGDFILVRVPPARELDAWKAIGLALSKHEMKVPIPRRLPPEKG